MPLTGFKAQNHPQQVLIDGPRADVDERATPPEAFAVWHRRWGFTVDAAALPYNAKLERFWTPEDDGLMQDWTGERVWCNPPFSNVEPWVRKAGISDAELVVMLLPANRTEQVWWQELVEPHRDGRGPRSARRVPPRADAVRSRRQRAATQHAPAVRDLPTHLGGSMTPSGSSDSRWVCAGIPVIGHPCPRCGR